MVYVVICDQLFCIFFYACSVWRGVSSLPHIAPPAFMVRLLFANSVFRAAVRRFEAAVFPDHSSRLLLVRLTFLFVTLQIMFVPVPDGALFLHADRFSVITDCLLLVAVICWCRHLQFTQGSFMLPPV